ncbi:MAG: phosphatase PAP2 family protein [Clostridia bacterium]|nr:phosphatase PAP2 family protein [Clostridia bacterium]
MEWEFYILDFIHKYLSNPVMDVIMKFVSFLGTFGIIWIAITIILLCTKKYRLLGRSLTINLVVNLVACNLVIKPIVARLRPFEFNQSINLLVSAPTDSSFPSGHTLFAFAAATIIFIYNKKVGLLMYLFACIMAFSRLYLYVHFPTDVAFGAVLGIILAITSHMLEKAIFKPKSE